MHNKLIILSLIAFVSFSGAANPSLRDIRQDTRVSIYPNPAEDILMVQIDGNITPAKFELNSMIGNKVMIKPEVVGQGKYKIPVKDLATGYYFLIIKDEEDRFKKALKFLKR